MICLKRFDLLNKDEWQLFYSLFNSYLKEVCDEQEYIENLNELHDEKLNEQLIEQTFQSNNPYFIMKIINNGNCIGLISYSINEKYNSAFINNFFVIKEFRGCGIGSSTYTLVEEHLKALGTAIIELIPVDNAEKFYIKNGFKLLRLSADGEKIYRKSLILQASMKE